MAKAFLGKNPSSMLHVHAADSAQNAIIRDFSIHARRLP